MNTQQHMYGYYHVSFTSEIGTSLIRSNSERAFIVSQLQYFLSPRLILGDIPAYKQLASCIDLLSFSIRHDAIEFLIFSIDPSLCHYFASCIINGVEQYHSDLAPSQNGSSATRIRSSVQKLTGVHQALAVSLTLHLRHEDWEYDRYSSIGFYLHDRRGDWMRTWRLARLYENNPEQYRTLLHEALYRSSVVTTANSRYYAP